MTIYHTCPVCRVPLKAPNEFAGRRVRCPTCRAELKLPAAPPEEEIVTAEVVDDPPSHASTGDSWDIPFLHGMHGPRRVEEFIEPPQPSQAKSKPDAPPPNAGDWAQRMFAALLDPRSIQWLLTLGGSLMVLGVLIWLISWGVLDNPLMVAAILGAASLAVLIGGWLLTLRTRHRISGRALTFLGCVVTPLNLWFYHAQGLVTIDGGLWIGGVVCVLLYAATVRILRDPLFMYAVEAGITLTAVLLLGSFGLHGEATQLSILLTALALVSIHGHKAFRADVEEFNQQQFGMPLFWCGHAQLAAALIILLATQIAGHLTHLANVFELPAEGVLLTNSRLAPGLLWMAAAYAYLYSDLAVRRVGVYIYLAAICLVMGQATLIGFDLIGMEGLIAALAATSAAVAILASFAPPKEERLARAVPPLALVLSIVPVMLGVVLHLRATSALAFEFGFRHETTWAFVAAMLLVAVANRASAFIYRKISPSLAAVYLFFAAGALIVAAAGALRMWGVEAINLQVAWLMLIPMGYLIAARLWQGHSPEQPLVWVAHVAAGVLLAHGLFAALEGIVTGADSTAHVYLAIMLAEAAAFYAMSAFFRRHVESTYLAVAAACGAVWQALLAANLSYDLFTIVFAVVGLGMLVAARSMGLDRERLYNAKGGEKSIARGRGLAVLHASHGLLSITFLIALMQGLGRLAAAGFENRTLDLEHGLSVALMTCAALAAIVASPRGDWRRLYTVAAVALAGVGLLMINVAIDISLWRKVEVVLVGLGLVLVGVGYAGRFREAEASAHQDTASLCLWLGSFLAATPLALAVFYHWGSAGSFALYDELALITITVLLLASGVVWQFKAPTLLGGATLAVYLAALIVSVLYRPQVAIGIYLAGGGALLFGVGLVLAMYRERLAALPERLANREGLFRVIGWR